MSKFETLYPNFAEYHQNFTNIVIHTFAIPLVVFAEYGLLFSLSRTEVLKSLPFSLCWVFYVISGLLFLKTHIKIGLITFLWSLPTLLLARLADLYYSPPGSSYSASWMFLIILMCGFAAQTIGHKFFELRIENDSRVFFNFFYFPFLLTAILIHRAGLYPQEFQACDTIIKKKLSLLENQ